MNLQIHADRSRDKLTVIFEGRLDCLSADEILEALLAFKARSFITVDLNLADATITDPTAIDKIVEANRVLSAAGTELCLVGTRPVLSVSERPLSLAAAS
jgi:anti-anti-sigma regulatory factor